MSTLIEKLAYLEETKDIIKNAIIAKGVEVNETDTFRDYATKISTIQTGSGEAGLFEYNGWTADNFPELYNAMAYAKQLKDNPADTYTNDKNIVLCPVFEPFVLNNDMFKNCSNMLYFPDGITIASTGAITAFKGCKSLKEIDLSGLTITGEMGGLFWDCSSLTDITLSGSNVNTTNMELFCSNCAALKTIDLSGISLNWGSLESAFHMCEALESIDLSNANISTNNFSYAFNKCNALKTANLSGINAKNTMYGSFNECTSLNTVNLSNANINASLENLFYLCNSLINVKFTNATVNATNTNYMFNYCTNLNTITLPEDFRLGNQMFRKCTNLSTIYGTLKYPNDANVWICSASEPLGGLRYMVVKDLGINQLQTSLDVSGCSVWGIDSSSVTNARQSLIDSLITYSFDRAAAGYSTLTLTLHTNVFDVLTEEEIAAITAKGYTVIR